VPWNKPLVGLTFNFSEEVEILLFDPHVTEFVMGEGKPPPLSTIFESPKAWKATGGALNGEPITFKLFVRPPE